MTRTYKINLIIQAVMFSTFIGLLVSMIFNAHYIFFFMLFLILLGFIQYVSAWVLWEENLGNKRLKRYLWLASGGIIFSFSIFISSHSPVSFAITFSTVMLYSVALAIFYWKISFQYFSKLFFKSNFH